MCFHLSISELMTQLHLHIFAVLTNIYSLRFSTCNCRLALVCITMWNAGTWNAQSDKMAFLED